MPSRRSADYNRDATVPPAAILWPDEKRDWETLVRRLREALLQFLVFGALTTPLTFQARRNSAAISRGPAWCRSLPGVSATPGRRPHLANGLIGRGPSP